MFKYFNFYPKIGYSFTTNSSPIAITNILKRIKVLPGIKENTSIYTKIIVTDRDSPESIAHRFYRDTGLHWIILLMNDIIDPFFEWPIDQFSLGRLITKKYGAGNENNTHHWENPKQYEVNSTTAYASPVTNTEYEERQNESYREIRVLDLVFVNKFISEYKKLIKENN